MPRFIFSPSAVTTGGREARVTFYRSSTSTNQVKDLYRVDVNDLINAPITNGTIVTAADGVVGSFAGPDDVSTLYIATNEGSRSAVQAARPAGADAATVILIDNIGALPAGLKPGTIVVVKS